MTLNTDTATLLVRAIIQQQQTIMGPLAVLQANKVSGLTVSTDMATISIDRNMTDVLQDLVHQYEELFGRSSLEVCKESVKQVASQVKNEDIPQFLR